MKKLTSLILLCLSPSFAFADVVANQVEVGHMYRDAVNPNQQDIWLDPTLFQASATGNLEQAALFAGLIVGALFVYSIITAIG